MPYIGRNQLGEIVATSETKTQVCSEFIETDTPEFFSYLLKVGGVNLETLKSDLDLVRVIEDLVDVLVAKSVISINDLPPAVQRKLLSRKSIRSQGGLGAQHDLIEL